MGIEPMTTGNRLTVATSVITLLRDTPITPIGLQPFRDWFLPLVSTYYLPNAVIATPYNWVHSSANRLQLFVMLLNAVYSYPKVMLVPPLVLFCGALHGCNFVA